MTTTNEPACRKCNDKGWHDDGEGRVAVCPCTDPNEPADPCRVVLGQLLNTQWAKNECQNEYLCDLIAKADECLATPNPLPALVEALERIASVEGLGDRSSGGLSETARRHLVSIARVALDHYHATAKGEA